MQALTFIKRSNLIASYIAYSATFRILTLYTLARAI